MFDALVLKLVRLAVAVLAVNVDVTGEGKRASTSSRDLLIVSG
jgi:hypothetical protein